MLDMRSKKEEAQFPIGKTSIIGNGMRINGEIETDADIRIDGILVGNVKSTAKVVIGAEGQVKGNITARQVDITGKVIGNITVDDLVTLHNQAHVIGDVVTQKMSMESSVTFNGKCTMKVESHTKVVEKAA